MKSEVEALVRAAVAMDPSITPEMTDLALAALKGMKLIRVGDKSEAGTCEILTPIVTIREACQVLRKDRTTVWRMLNNGILIRVFGSGDRMIGISRDSVARVLTGVTSPHRKKRRRT